MRERSLRLVLIKNFLWQPELRGRVSIREMGTGWGTEGKGRTAKSELNVRERQTKPAAR